MPHCGEDALERYWETCETGSINLNHTIICTACDYAEGDLPDSYCEACQDNYYPEIDAILTEMEL